MTTKTVPEADITNSLPITQYADEIQRAITAHQVVIIAGETGSGKSTQIPQLCLAAGRGGSGLIGCTQPRRIAARSVAKRVAEELDCELGGQVGYQVRFHDRRSEATQIKFMTDGILLAEIQSSPQLSAYDTLIIDEAHERSLNIDFLLGYLAKLLPRRPDLKLIITSATINTEQFSSHFDDAPVIEVGGRSYPVDIEYQPPREGEFIESQIRRAIDRLTQVDPRGDVLVFLPGERDIFQVAKALRKASLKHTEIVPLYARLPSDRQDQIFRPSVGRRIVLATNVAETSLTVPGIRFVIDTGLARISRYAAHSRVLRLPIEPISQASCQQRAGRCGRVGPGICIRLYEESDYLLRPPFTEPEIQRSSLVGVILNMLALGLGEPEAFPFIDQPPNRLIGEAWQTLFELGAIDSARQLTPVGQRLARIPVDARLGRMLLVADDLGVVDELCILVAALSMADVRDRPMEAAQQADTAHREFAVPKSDFLTQLKVWDWWQEVRRTLSSHQANREAKAHFLAPNRLHEWGQLYRQLKAVARESGLTINPERSTDDEVIHRALLSGLLGLVGRLEDQGIYEGVRGHRFRIFPGSVLAKSQPAWVMAAERVETGQTYARMVASIDPQWLEAQAGHLMKRRVFDPYWSRRQGRVLGYEQLSLHGLIIVTKRRIHYGPHDPATARALFIKHALALGEINFNATFLKHNASLKAILAEHEHKQRRRDILSSDEVVMAFFDQRLPADIFTTKAFARWHEGLSDEEKQALILDQAALLREGAELAPEDAFPDTLECSGESFQISYCFDPSSDQDGITLDCPLYLVNQLDEERLEWLVPGLVEEKVASLISSLKKSQRRLLIPIKDFAQAACEALSFAEGSLRHQLAAVLSQMTGLSLDMADFDINKLSKHLIIQVRVLDEGRQVLGQGRDISALKHQFSRQAREQFMAHQAAHWHQDDLSLNALEPLPPVVTTAGGHQAWPAWVDQGRHVGIRLFDTPEDARLAHESALVSLLRELLSDRVKYITKNQGFSHSAQVAWAMQEDVALLSEGIIDQLIAFGIQNYGIEHIRDAQSITRCQAAIAQSLVADYQTTVTTLNRILVKWQGLRMRIQELAYAVPRNIEDVESQLTDLIYPSFIRDIDLNRLPDYERYLKAIELRLDGLEQDPKRDWDRQQQVARFWARYLDHLEQGHWYTDALDHYRWAVEEYRVQLFAQTLGTQQKVSPKRLEALWEAVEKNGR